MLIIRQEQLEMFARAALENLEHDLFRRERLRVPHVVPRPGDDEALRACIRLAFAKADEAGFTDRAAALAYAQAVLDCGLGFATDPMHRWAAAALRSEADPVERGQLLLRAMTYWMPRLTESELRHAESMAERLDHALEGGVELVPDELPAVFLRHLASGIRRVNGLDIHGEQRLFRVAEAMARQQGLSGPLSASFFLLLVVLFGHECTVDPRYAWIESAALSSTDQPPNLRMKTVLDLCRCHITEHLAGAVSQQLACDLPARVLPSGQRFAPIALWSTLPAEDESDATRLQA